MSKLVYQEIPEFDSSRVDKQLSSGLESEIISGLVSTAFYSSDYQLTLKYSIKFSSSPNENIRGCAVECFGHIARLHGKLDLVQVVPLLKKGLLDESDFVKGKTEGAIDDISHFLGIKKKKLLRKIDKQG